MDKNLNAMSIFPSFGFQYSKKSRYGGTGINMWHPGYAWACTRKAYERMGGLYDKAILGSGDNIMSLCLINKGLKAINENSTDDYIQSVLDFQDNVKTLTIASPVWLIKLSIKNKNKAIAIDK
jgi:hypothetical protein